MYAQRVNSITLHTSWKFARVYPHLMKRIGSVVSLLMGSRPKGFRCNGPLTRYVKLQVAHAPGMPGTFSPAADFKGNRKLAIPTCITARAWRTCRDACRDRAPAVTGKTFPAFPAHAHLQFCVSGKRPISTETHVRRAVKVLMCHVILCFSAFKSQEIGLLAKPSERNTVGYVWRRQRTTWPDETKCPLCGIGMNCIIRKLLV